MIRHHGDCNYWNRLTCTCGGISLEQWCREMMHRRPNKFKPELENAVDIDPMVYAAIVEIAHTVDGLVAEDQIVHRIGKWFGRGRTPS